MVDHDPKFTSEVFRAFVKSMGSCLIVGSAYRKNTNVKAERANGVIGDTLRAYANGRKGNWDLQLPLAVFAIENLDSGRGARALLHRPLRASSPAADGPCSQPSRRQVACTLRASWSCRCASSWRLRSCS